MGRKISLLLMAVLCSSCTVLHKEVGRPLDMESIHYDVGRTHYHAVLDALGPPARMTALPSGFAFLYESLSIRERQLGISSQYEWLQLIKLSLADSDLRRNCLLLHFNSEGLLVSQSSINTLERLGMGGSIQPILSLQQIVDTAEYEDDAYVAMGWGASLLSPLPQTINMNQSLNSGSAGLEQSGTTSKIGQHTLEMR